MEIHGVPIEEWRKAFAECVRMAIDQDDFTDILRFQLYPDTLTGVEFDNEMDEYAVYETHWGYVKDAFEIIFGEKYNFWEE